MKRLFVVFCLIMCPPLILGCGSSPKEAGKAFAKTVISSLDSGNPSAMQDATAKAQAKAKGMSPSDAAKFIEGYNEVVMPWIQSKMLK